MKKITRRNFIVGLTSLAVTSRLSLAASGRSKRIYIGTYTRKSSQGVYVYRWKPESGEMEQIGLAAKTPNPSFLTLSPNHNNLYCVNEQDHANGNVSAFAIDRATGTLMPKNVAPSGGSAPCNLTTDHTGQSLFVANYSSGSVSSYKILSGGSLSQPVSNIFFKGHSIDPERQKGAHTHCTTVSPENKYLLVNDLGLDRIMVFHFDPTTAKLAPNDPPFYSAVPGSGPRNLTFHPNGKWAYSIAEMGSIIECMDWNGEKGILTRFQVISSLPKEHKTPTDAATVQVHPNGRFLYGSNRGDDSITAFSIHPKNGHLALIQRISCEGGSPRHFAVAPDGKWLVVANQDTANIVILKCDPATGKLAAIGRQYPLDSPVCVVFDE
ncbi:MAG: lactonase family protein [Acidobacteriota bacterium]